jgi:prepilin-type N-terminal cleavage/methylation domain-containing protein
MYGFFYVPAAPDYPHVSAACLIDKTSRGYNQQHMNTRTRGFTLIELLVVIAIIGILSAVVLASLNSARQKGRDTRRIADVKQLQVALEFAYDAASPDEYPDGTAGLAPTHISTVPTDPGTNAAYAYDNLTGAGAACSVASGVCNSYVIGATLEDTNHNALASDIDGTVGGVDCDDPMYCVRP